jgi:hypothetical protein
VNSWWGWLWAELLTWFRPSWWKYLLEPPRGGLGRLATIRCRAMGHPCGPVWYNCSGLEPDWRCRDCGDNLG